jgi:serine/threonine protein kinase
LDATSDEKMYLVMPHMANGNLGERAAMYRGSIDSTLEVALPLALALGHAHSHGVVHRDVKPANILFAEQNNVPTLSDFGICLIRDEPRTTETGEVVGPRAFIAPELEGGGKLDAAPVADVYSLGKVIYFMLSGGKILPRERQAEPEFDVFTGKGLRHELLAKLISRMICPSPGRIQSMAEVAAEIQRIQAWDRNVVRPLSSASVTSLTKLAEQQREATSVAEHNRLVVAARDASVKRYAESAVTWLSSEVCRFATAITSSGVATANLLSAGEIQKSLSEFPEPAPGTPLVTSGFSFDPLVSGAVHGNRLLFILFVSAKSHPISAQHRLSEADVEAILCKPSTKGV